MTYTIKFADFTLGAQFQKIGGWCGFVCSQCSMVAVPMYCLSNCVITAMSDSQYIVLVCKQLARRLTQPPTLNWMWKEYVQPKCN